jgi:fatty acid desaturase
MPLAGDQEEKDLAFTVFRIIGGALGMGLWQYHYGGWAAAIGAAIFGLALLWPLGVIAHELLVIAEAKR